MAFPWGRGGWGEVSKVFTNENLKITVVITQVLLLKKKNPLAFPLPNNFREGHTFPACGFFTLRNPWSQQAHSP